MMAEKRTLNRTARGRKLFLLTAASLMIVAALSPWLAIRSFVSAAGNYQTVGPDLRIIKLLTPDSPLAIGGQAVYSIVVDNVGDTPVTGVVTVTDVLPASLTYVSASGGADWSCSAIGQTVTCTHQNVSGLASLSSLPAIFLTAQVGQAAAPSVINTATVANATDVSSANNSSSFTATVISADIAVTKTVTPDTQAELGTVSYAIGVTNLGPSTATTIALTDVLPTQVTFTSANATQGTYNSSTGVWDVGSLTLNQTATLTIQATVNANTRGQTIVNTTDGLTSDPFDYNTTNNSASDSFRVASMRLIGRVTDLGSTQPVVGVTVLVTDTLNNSYSTLTAASGWYTFTDTTTTPLAAGNATVKARKTGYRSEQVTKNLLANQDNTQNFALGTTDLTVTKTDDQTTILAGETYSYTITVFNFGSIVASDFAITDTLSQYLTYITDTMGVDNSKTGDTYVWRLTDDLMVNESREFEVSVRVDNSLPSASTSIVNTAQVGTTSPELNRTNNTATDTNTGAGTHNISIALTLSPSSARSGQNVTYTIRATNNGSSSVTDVVVTDTFSQYLDLVSASTTKGSRELSTSARRVTANIGTLAAGESATVTVVTTVNSVARANTTVSNSASVSYRFGGQTFTKTSSSVSFQLVFSSTLPGTGFGRARAPLAGNPVAQIYLAGLMSTLLLAVVGVLAFIFGLRLRIRQSDWANWTIRMGLLFCTAALVFGVATWGLAVITQQDSPSMLLAQVKSEWAAKSVPFGQEDPPYVYVPQQGDLEVLPDFPIPEPSNVTPDENGDSPDTSPINRIVLPTLGVDTVVKYVPYDGNTWLIAGLQQEVAWMGDTSWPGLGGNTGLAGHVSLRNGRDGPFRYLDQLQTDDQVLLYTEENMYSFRVRETRVVSEAEMSVIEPTTNSQITLITCTNYDTVTGYYLDRLIIMADLLTVVPLENKTQGN